MLSGAGLELGFDSLFSRQLLRERIFKQFKEGIQLWLLLVLGILRKVTLVMVSNDSALIILIES